MNAADRPTLSVAETADLLGISRWLVQQAVSQGTLPSLRLGRRILIPKARLQEWLDGESFVPAVVPPGPSEPQRRTAEAIASAVPRVHAR